MLRDAGVEVGAGYHIILVTPCHIILVTTCLNVSCLRLTPGRRRSVSSSGRAGGREQAVISARASAAQRAWSATR